GPRAAAPDRPPGGAIPVREVVPRRGAVPHLHLSGVALTADLGVQQDFIDVGPLSRRPPAHAEAQRQLADRRGQLLQVDRHHPPPASTMASGVPDQTSATITGASTAAPAVSATGSSTFCMLFPFSLMV